MSVSILRTAECDFANRAAPWGGGRVLIGMRVSRADPSLGIELACQTVTGNHPRCIQVVALQESASKLA